ncbi:MAG: hypothetical protein RLZZ450_5073 [Pseudomonadota bacterium]|jgi:hypothetical protein
MDFLAWLRLGVAPELVWGSIPRIVGALYAIAFVSLSGQLLGLVGSRGISPAREQLAAMRAHYPGPLRFVRLPTLLWLSPSDRFLATLPWLGMAAGLYALVGGPGSFWALAACFVLYLSLDVAALMFPWDCLLLEAGFLALFLPEPRMIFELGASSLPLPVVAFTFRFLIVRVMWGFALLKFVGTKRGDSLYLQGFLAWMPMCTPLGFWAQHAPTWLLRAAYGFMMFVEVLCPPLVFFTGLPRAVAAVGLMSLMAGIWATGNWGFFNVGYGALCVVLLDTQSSLFDTTWQTMTASPSALFVHVALALHALGALLYFPTSSWATHTVSHWPFDDYVWDRPVLRGVIGIFRALSPFRLMHGYGVFPPNSAPPIKVIPVFEGSRDGATWQAYEYSYMPMAPTSRSPIVAPHHPRLDHLCVYAGSGMSESDYLASLVGGSKVYGFSPFSHFSWLHRVCERLLEGEPSVRGLFAAAPFSDAPPTYVRISLRALTPASLETHGRTGESWRVRDAGTLLSARERDALVFDHWLSPPELFHPDAVHWRRKSPALCEMTQAIASGIPLDRAVCLRSELSAAEVATFWSEFIPHVASTRGDLGAADETAREVRARFGKEAVLRFERIAERYVFILRTRLEPHFFGTLEPRIPKRSNFRFHLLLHELILDGRDRFEQVLASPGLAVARADTQTEQTELHFIAVLRNETVRFHGRTLRIARRMTNVFEQEIPGIMEFRDLLSQAVPSDEVWLPDLQRSESGVWRCDNF